MTNTVSVTLYGCFHSNLSISSFFLWLSLLLAVPSKVPLNNKKTLLSAQRSLSSEREESDAGMDSLEEPLRARKRRESTMPQGSSLAELAHLSPTTTIPRPGLQIYSSYFFKKNSNVKVDIDFVFLYVSYK